MRKLMILAAVLGLGQAWAAVTLTAGKLEVAFEPEQRYALASVAHREHGFLFADGSAALQARSPWLLTVHDAAGRTVDLTAQEAKSATHEAAQGRLTVVWEGVGSEACPANLKVTMTVRAEGERSLWRLAVEGQAPGALYRADFPRLAGLNPVGEDRLLVPHYLGRLVRDPVKYARTQVTSYPSPLSMQFLATYGTKDRREPETAALTESGWFAGRNDATGLYMAAEDGQCYYKRFGFDTRETPGKMRLWVEHLPGLAQWPPAAGMQAVNYAMPYEVAVAAFTGDAWAVGKLYRDFAQKQFWCERGPADKWPTKTPAPGSKELTQYTPQWFRDTAFWAKYYHEPAKIVPEWAAYAKWLRVPIASHYYRGTIAVFDDNYPEMLPTDPYYISGVRDAKDMSVRPLPYTNAVIWDQDTQSYIKENGAAAAIKDEAGNIPIWDIHNELYAYMCPGAEHWRNEVSDTAYRQIAEHGLSGVYLDCLTATRSQPCYDPGHGHTLHGGNSYGMGQHAMMEQMRSRARAVDPEAAFFPEQCGEWVIDVMDGFLTLDISRAARQGGEQIYPLFPIVYHDYTMYFGCDAIISLPVDKFAWEMGQMLMWGSVPLNSHGLAPDPVPGEARSEMLRDVVQAYYVAGLPFLQGGESVQMGTRDLSVQTATTGVAPLELAARPHEVETGSFNRKYGWNGPAVLGSAWRRQGDVGVVLVNVTGEDQPIELRIDRKALGLPADAKLVRTWPREPQTVPAADVLKTTLPAQRVAIYVLTTDVAKASVGRKLLDTPWELLTVEEGEFKPLDGPAGTLWACSDGPVANVVRSTGTVAMPQWVNETGKIANRQGLRVKLKEGQALPRKFEEKPFLLLRQLPATAAGQGQVVVLSGDENHLSCVAEGPMALQFAQPGLVVASEMGTGKPVQPLASQSRLQVPAGQQWVVGYARPDAAGLAVLLQTADAASKQQAARLAQQVTALTQKPSADGLSGVSYALVALEQGLSELPGAFVPETPLEALHRQVQALVVGQTAARLWATGEHDWLAPGLTTQVQARLWPTRSVASAKWAAIGTGVQARESSASEAAVTVTDAQYIERMVPVLATSGAEQGGAKFMLADILHMDANHAMEFQGPNVPMTAVAGIEARAAYTLRNWSPFPLTVKLAYDQPQGWEIKGPQSVEVPPLSNVTAPVKVVPPENLAQGIYQLKAEAQYSGQSGNLIAFATVNGQPKVVPVQAGDVQWPQPKPEELARIRQNGRMVVYAQAGEPLALTIRNMRVSIYTNTLSFRLLGPDLKLIQEGQVRVDESLTIDRKAEQTGAHFLELAPGSGSVVVEGGPRGMAEVAAPGAPLELFTCPLTRYFHVPAGAKQFALAARDGGPDETAKFVITAPGGRVALERNGNFGGAQIPIEVRPDEAGKIWTLRVEPVQDISFSLTGDAAPYLSTDPARVLTDRP